MISIEKENIMDNALKYFKEREDIIYKRMCNYLKNKDKSLISEELFEYIENKAYYNEHKETIYGLKLSTLYYDYSDEDIILTSSSKEYIEQRKTIYENAMKYFEERFLRLKAKQMYSEYNEYEFIEYLNKINSRIFKDDIKIKGDFKPYLDIISLVYVYKH